MTSAVGQRRGRVFANLAQQAGKHHSARQRLPCRVRATRERPTIGFPCSRGGLGFEPEGSCSARHQCWCCGAPQPGSGNKKRLAAGGIEAFWVFRANVDQVRLAATGSVTRGGGSRRSVRCNPRGPYRATGVVPIRHDDEELRSSRGFRRGRRWG